MLFTEFIANLATAFYDKFTVGGKLPVDIAVGDSVELTNTTVAKALAARLANAAGAAFVEPPTQADVQAITAKLIASPSTEATAAAILAKIIAAPATEAKQDTLKTAVDLLATQATLAAVLAKLTADPATATGVAAVATALTRTRSSLDNPTDYRDPTDPVNTADADASVFPGALAGDQLKVILLPAGYHHHDVSLCWPANAVVNAEAVYDVYGIHDFALMGAFAVANYRGWPKLVDNLTKSGVTANDNAQAVVPGDMLAIAVVIRSVAVAPTNDTARVIVRSR